MLAIALFGLLPTQVLVSCSGFHRAYRADNASCISDPEIHFVEADDEGWFWDPRQPDKALEAVRSAANAGDTVVVTFVHGWHHLSKCCDENLEGFKEVLVRLKLQLSREMYTSARQRIHRTENRLDDVRIVGIYVGWRGRELPGVLDYATFWKRKAAAERVGETDLQEFLVRLRNFHESHQPSGVDSEKPPDYLLGMVTIGHSFGGQIVVRATSAYLEHKLESINDESGYLRRKRNTISPGPARSNPVSGFGDLVVLVNPAVEASAYQRLHNLSRMQFPSEQWPLVLVISAENDHPRQRLFRWGRIAGEIFTGKPPLEVRERDLERTALGFSAEQTSHVLHSVDTTRVLVKTSKPQRIDPHCTECEGKTFDWYDWKTVQATMREPDSLTADVSDTSGTQKAIQLAAAVEKVRQFDFAGRTVFSDVVLEPDPNHDPIPHQPFIVANAKKNVIDGHNGMFSGPLMDFLTTYIAFAEAKRLFSQLPATFQPDM